MLFETVRKGKYLTDDKPDAVYEVIETMLHEATYQNEENPGSLLEVYFFPFLFFDSLWT